MPKSSGIFKIRNIKNIWIWFINFKFRFKSEKRYSCKKERGGVRFFSGSVEILPNKNRGHRVYLQIINSWGYQSDLFLQYLAKLVDTDRLRAEDTGLSLLQRTLKAKTAGVELNFTLKENPNGLWPKAFSHKHHSTRGKLHIAFPPDL